MYPQVTNERDRPPRGRSIDEYLALFRGSFAEVEWAAIDGRESGGGGGGGPRPDADDEAARWARFYRHWSLKESYIKAHGQGLGHKVERLVFRYVDPYDPRCAEAYVTVDGRAPKPPWTFTLSKLDAEHGACVARAPPQHCHPSFRATCDRPTLSHARHAAGLECAHPPWRRVSVRDLLPETARRELDALLAAEVRERNETARRAERARALSRRARL